MTYFPFLLQFFSKTTKKAAGKHPTASYLFQSRIVPHGRIRELSVPFFTLWRQSHHPNHRCHQRSLLHRPFLPCRHSPSSLQFRILTMRQPAVVQVLSCVTPIKNSCVYRSRYAGILNDLPLIRKYVPKKYVRISKFAKAGLIPLPAHSSRF